MTANIPERHHPGAYYSCDARYADEIRLIAMRVLGAGPTSAPGEGEPGERA